MTTPPARHLPIRSTETCYFLARTGGHRPSQQPLINSLQPAHPVQSALDFMVGPEPAGLVRSGRAAGDELAVCAGRNPVLLRLDRIDSAVCDAPVAVLPF